MRDIRPLESARWKVDHAKWHINRMNRAINKYGESEPCRVVSYPELDGVPKLRLKIERPPISISLALGDALGCMRAALDHLATGFADGSADINTKFPITQPDSATLPGTRIKVPNGRGKLIWGKKVTHGWSEAAVDFAKMHNPHQGDPDWWNHPLPVMNMMVNADKHKMVRMVGAATASISYRFIELQIHGVPPMIGDPAGNSIVTSDFAQVLQDGDDIQLFKFGAGQKIAKVDIQPIASVEVTAEGWPSEEIGMVMIRCHEAVDAIVASAESSWDQLVPSGN